MSSHKLSLFEATLLNVNIMLGTGAFINTVLLAHLSGMAGSVSYIVVAALLLPLLYVIGSLVNTYPDGGFYAYSKNTLGIFWGFISGWIYFVGKLASGTLMIHVSSSLLQTFFVPLQWVPTFTLDLVTLALFIYLNMHNLKVGTMITKMFIVLKALPIIGTFLATITYFKPEFIAAGPYYWGGITTSLPYVLYAFISFEMSCSLSRSIENPERNASRSLYFSYLTVLIITVLFQTSMYLLIGPRLGSFSSFLDAFPALFASLFPQSQQLVLWLSTTAHTAIAFSALGGAYGLLFSNHWNLYTLARNGHIPFAHLMTQLNKHGTPYAGVIVEGIICVAYLMASGGAQTILQQIGALGPTLTFGISVIGFLVGTSRGKIKAQRWTGWLALISCLVLMGVGIQTMLASQLTAGIVIITILAVGFALYVVTKRP
ncbi:APC family permease [Candidatus Babeliales bacterium]|nr:APC family permease [Candidatus Babeliales bacterium]